MELVRISCGELTFMAYHFVLHGERRKFYGEVENRGDHFLWKISFSDIDFRCVPRNFFSPYFEHAGRVWGLQISSSHRRHIHLILKNYGDSVDSDRVTLGIEVDGAFMLRNAQPDASGRIFTASNVMSHDELFSVPNDQIFPGEVLTIVCKIETQEQNEEEEKHQHELESIENLQQDMGNMLYNADALKHNFSDVSFRVQNTHINAHRNILSARSPVLADMVSRSSDVKDLIRIPDVAPHTFSDFLYYLYTGSFKKLNSRVAARLHSLAEKYMVPELKKECERIMKRKHEDEEPISVELASSSEEENESVVPSPRKVPPKKRKS